MLNHVWREIEGKGENDGDGERGRHGLKRKRARGRGGRQRAFVFRTWGGKREGAGRPKTRPGTWVEHTRRKRVDPRAPLHVTVRMNEGVARLRRRNSFRAIRRALAAARARAGFRICQFSVQSNHM